MNPPSPLSPLTSSVIRIFFFFFPDLCVVTASQSHNRAMSDIAKEALCETMADRLKRLTGGVVTIPAEFTHIIEE